MSGGLMKNKFLNADCMDYMPKFKDNHFDLAIVDPPYGLGKKIVDGGTVSPLIRDANKKVKEWDKVPSKKYFTELKRVSKNQIIWGGNYFNLPPCRCYIVWDKTIHGNTYSDCDFAWTSFDLPARVWAKNIVNVTMDGRIHPTQKPIALYRWLLQNYAKPGDLILDSHVGSGSSLVACIMEGFDYIGYEIDKEYYDDAMKRIKAEMQKISLF